MSKKKRGIRRTIVFDQSVDNELNQYIDGDAFRNRSHAIQSILKMWLRWRRGQKRGEQTNIFDMQSTE